MNNHNLTMSKMTMLLSLILLHAGINQQTTAAQDQDWVKCFPDSTSNITVIDVKSIVASNAFKTLYQPPKEAKLTFFESLILQSTRITTDSRIILNSSPVFAFEGDFDQDKLINDIKAYGQNNELNIKRNVTEELVGNHKIIRVGNEVYCVLKKSLIVHCSSPPPAAKKDSGLFAEVPGAAEQKIKDAISRIKNNENPSKEFEFAALLPKIKTDKPIIFIDMENKKQKHLAYAEIRDNDIYFIFQVDYAELQLAIDAEKEYATRVRDMLKTGEGETENLPIWKFIKDVKPVRVDKKITMELLLPVDVLKKSIDIELNKK